MLTIIGLGPGNPGQLTLEALDAMEGAGNLFLRTAVHPVVPYLEKRGIVFESFDALYEEKDSFEGVYQAIVDEILALAREKDVVYAVPGNPFFAEKTVTGLTARCDGEGIPCRVIGGMSFIDVAMAELGIDAVEGLKVIDAYELESQLPDKHCGNLITQVHSRHVASEVKLFLSEYYADDFEVTLIINGGIPGEQVIKRLPLYQIDREDRINHLTTLYLPPLPDDNRDFTNLLRVMATLRAPGGCPWDREQTHETLKPYLLEEAYEAVDAIETGDMDNLVEELGDVLFQIVFHAQVGKEEGIFTINDVIEGINEKMIRRHPHVFGTAHADTPEQVAQKWDAIKKKEKSTSTLSDEMDRIPAAYTALMTAGKLQSKAGKVGFDWDDPRPALDKVYEEAGEVRKELEGNDPAALEEELGDLLFAAVNVIRLSGFQPELVLKKGNAKFKRRFGAMENLAEKEGRSLSDYSLEGLETLWQGAKSLNLAE